MFCCSWWKHAGNLASYEQQDAHEFFISILESVHEMIKKDQQKTHNTGDFISLRNLEFGSVRLRSVMLVTFWLYISRNLRSMTIFAIPNLNC